MTDEDRLTWLDALRVVAGLSMVGLHATSDPNGLPWPDYSVSDRVVPVILRSVLYIARTELFLIISAFLLLMALEKRPKTYREVIVIQSRRLLIPFVFWTVFYAAFGLIKAANFGYFKDALQDISYVSTWVRYVLLGDVKYHMHFIPTLFGMLLFFPIFKVASKYPIVGLMIFPALLVKWEVDAYLYTNFWEHDILPFAVRVTKIVTYVGYGILAGSAYGLWKRRRSVDLTQFVPIVLFVAGLLVAVKWIEAARIVSTGEYQFSYLAGYWANFLMPGALFCLCLCSGGRSWPHVLSRAAPFSFGVYLVHPTFLDVAEILFVQSVFAPSLQVIGKILIVLPSTFLAVFLLSKCRALAWTIGLGPLPIKPSRTVRA